MWIIPKQLHTSAFVADTKGLGLDSEEFSQMSEKSLMWRSKPSLSKTWLRRWKRVSWMQHLSSRILKRSHTESFVDAWTSSLAGSRASHFRLLDSVKELKTLDICSHISKKESETANLELFSSKTLKELSQVKRPMGNQFSNMSSENWKDWVTSQRLEFSQRVKLAHLTRERESLSLGSGIDWGTPATNDANKTPHCEVNSKQAGLTRSVGRAEANWATPQTFDANNLVRTPEKLAQTRAEKNAGCMNLREQVHYPDMDHSRKSWPTARARDWKDTPGCAPSKIGDVSLAREVYGQQDQPKPSTNGKNQGLLNPNWVEQLMGLPVGWTDLGYWGTELSQLHQPEHLLR